LQHSVFERINHESPCCKATLSATFEYRLNFQSLSGYRSGITKAQTGTRGTEKPTSARIFATDPVWRRTHFAAVNCDTGHSSATLRVRQKGCMSYELATLTYPIAIARP
jgi:hypothetical protein